MSIEEYYRKLDVEKKKRRMKKNAANLALRLRWKQLDEERSKKVIEYENTVFGLSKLLADVLAKKGTKIELENHDAIKILSGILKGNDIYAIAYYIMEFLSYGIVSSKDVVDLAETLNNPFKMFVIGYVLYGIGYGGVQSSPVSNYLDYTVAPLEYKYELERIMAKEYSEEILEKEPRGRGLNPYSMNDDLKKLVYEKREPEEVYALVDRLHSIDTDDRYTSKVVKMRILKKGQKLYEYYK